MKSICFLLLIFPIGIHAQEVSDDGMSNASSNEIKVEISQNDLLAIEKEKEEANNKYAKLNEQYGVLLDKYHKDSAALKSALAKNEVLSSDVQSLKETCKTYKSKNEKFNKILVSMASNFLYIPYEAYSVEKIAIPAYEAIDDSVYKQKHIVRYQLLKNYQTDIKQLLEFLQNEQADLGKPFSKNQDAQTALNLLQKESYVIAYRKYDDWQETYIGKIIQKVSKELRAFDGNNHKIDFSATINDLNRCVKTINDL